MIVVTYLMANEGPIHTLERKDSLLNVHWGENCRLRMLVVQHHPIPIEDLCVLAIHALRK